jgi:hypothetical protein
MAKKKAMVPDDGWPMPDVPGTGIASVPHPDVSVLGTAPDWCAYELVGPLTYGYCQIPKCGQPASLGIADDHRLCVPHQHLAASLPSSNPIESMIPFVSGHCLIMGCDQPVSLKARTDHRLCGRHQRLAASLET